MTLTFTTEIPDDLPIQDRDLLIKILNDTVNDTIIKFYAGYKEHGGSLLDGKTIKHFLVEAMKENIDQNVYNRCALLLLKEKLCAEIDDGK